ncbi:hypothetical protein FB45DRAFT_1046573 [Roridomyces roridus]|uniref:MYND-type domain-containing protein n=1 Tax=Roridomyces roridus TaxID=1738132 RepID=A0AAD7AXD4_9AGAR|nr:hypothetical protein FB45DRAFT_1046573 [Roridomyces roridus]
MSSRAGFLRLVASALEHPHLLSADYFKTGVLQSCTLFLPYRSVLLQFSSGLADMHAHMDSTVARQSPVWEAWEQLTHWYEYFAWMLEVHDSVDRITLRRCDNCELLSARTDLKSCSRCESVYYCSVGCQRRDWERGHRKTCAAIRSYSLEHPDVLSAPDRSFLRTMSRAICLQQISANLLIQLEAMKRAPHEIFTIMEWEEGYFRLAADFALPNGVLGPMWEDQLSRATVSRGRIHLVVIAVPRAPGQLLTRIVPLRMRSTALRDGL